MIFEYNNVVFEWDDDKAEKVLREHQVTFEEACSVFFDNMLIHESDYRDYKEERYFATGLTNMGRLITVVWTDREPNIRLITAFKATKEQIKRYQI